jgi:hypothetical protein
MVKYAKICKLYLSCNPVADRLPEKGGGMNNEEYKKRLKEINEEASAKKTALAKEYALAHNSINVGDVIEDHIGRIKVEKIGFPSKKGSKRWVYQSNLKLTQ